MAGFRSVPRSKSDSYRVRDELREVVIRLRHDEVPEGGVEVRGVEMRRASSRRPLTTLFATNGVIEELPTEDVATGAGPWTKALMRSRAERPT